MIRGDIFGRTVEMQGSPYTMLVFKREFDENLQAFMTEAYSRENIDVEEFLRIAWAMAKTYDDEVRDYESWLLEFDADLFDLREGQEAFSVIVSAIEAELFRNKQTIRARIKRRLKAFLRRVLERLG